MNNLMPTQNSLNRRNSRSVDHLNMINSYSSNDKSVPKLVLTNCNQSPAIDRTNRRTISGLYNFKKQSTNNDDKDSKDRNLLLSPTNYINRQISETSEMSTDTVSNFSIGSLARYYRTADENGEGLPCLVLARLEKIPIKDFSSEVRATLDVEKFLKEVVLILDMEANDVDTIVEHLLREIYPLAMDVSIGQMDTFITEAKNALFMKAHYENFSYQRLAKTLKGILINENEGLSTDQSWISAMCSLTCVHKRHVAIARLKTPVNLGRSSEGVYFVMLVITPKKEKDTKSDIELSRTFATLLSDMEFRSQLLFAQTEDEFKEMLQNHARDLAEEQRLYRRRSIRITEVMNQAFAYEEKFPLGNGIVDDLRKRIPVYISDYKDGIQGPGTIRKLVSAATFLYFACLLPSMAFGVLYDQNTDGKINVKRVILSQTVGGLCFALIGGQPLIVMLTTAPLTLYIKVIYAISAKYSLHFYTMFSWVGIFNSIFLILYSLLDLSKLMRWSTRSTEEIFALFISIAFIVDAVKDVLKVFYKSYVTTLVNKTVPIVNTTLAKGLLNSTNEFITITTEESRKENGLLFLLLLIGTVWLGIYFLNFTKTPFLNSSKRLLMADYSLPLAVLIMSFIGSYLFKDIKIDTFKTRSEEEFSIKFVNFSQISISAVFAALGLAFPLSLLFFMDQNVTSAMVNCPSNKLKKGSAYHWDLLIVAIINLVLSLFGLPWVHGTLPHSPLHVKALADLEERIDSGHRIYETIVKVRETRLTGLISHILIGLSLLLLPIPLIYVPIAVLDGLFVYMAITALYGNQLVERVILLFTEQAAYPPSHYLRRVPQRKVHLFTVLQLTQLGLLCALGFAPTPYAKIGFPILLLLQMPIRHWIFPKFISLTYIDALDKPI
uniref:Slc4a-4 n=1 Tax=Schmidtea mediterranea TaxID=79327 RepID=A0A0H3YEW7_SCHMD|nr:slc4a-4 [Schmidtea mediterranea]